MDNRTEKSGGHAVKIFTLRPIFGREDPVRSEIFTGPYNDQKGKFITG